MARQEDREMRERRVLQVERQVHEDPRAVVFNTEIGIVLTSKDMANDMGAWFDQNVGKVAFRLELIKDENGHERILWHGLDNGEQRVFNVEPHTGF